MKVQPAAFLRTTLPLGIDMLEQYDSGRYHSIWLPDHMVSFWPDSIWTPEFTDLATVSPSPHRHLDGMAVAAAAAVLTNEHADRHNGGGHGSPASRDAGADGADPRPPLRGPLHPGPRLGRAGEHRPLRLRLHKPVGRFEEAIKVIKLLWESDGPVDFDGRVLSARACAAGYRALRRQVPADLDRRRRTTDAGHHRPPRRRLVAQRRLHAGGLRREAHDRPRCRRAGGPRPDGDRSGDHPDLPHR